MIEEKQRLDRLESDWKRIIESYWN